MEVLQYVEGQSADEDKEPEFEIEDVDDEEGSIEEIELENGSTNDVSDAGQYDDDKLTCSPSLMTMEKQAVSTASTPRILMTTQRMMIT